MDAFGRNRQCRRDQHKEPVDSIDGWMHVVWTYDHQNASTPKKPVGSIDAWIGEWTHVGAAGKSNGTSPKRPVNIIDGGCTRFNERSYQPRGE